MRSREGDGHVGPKIKALRERLGLTLAELASALETTRAELRLIESGSRRISPRQLIDAARALDVSPSSFFADAHDAEEVPEAHVGFEPSPGDRKRVLVLDEAESERALIASVLRGGGYDVTEAADEDAARLALKTGDFDLLLMDPNMRRSDGLRLAREIRAGSTIRIIMVTARSAPSDRIDGLESGADDYVLKPFVARELVLRIGSVLRGIEPIARSSAAPAGTAVDKAVHVFGGFQLDAKCRLLTTVEGAHIDLTDYEFRLLSLFVGNPGRALSRREICFALNGRDWSPFDRTVDAHVARLRRKLGESEGGRRLIKSIRNAGYILATKVESLSEAPKTRALSDTPGQFYTR